MYNQVTNELYNRIKGVINEDIEIEFHEYQYGLKISMMVSDVKKAELICNTLERYSSNHRINDQKIRMLKNDFHKVHLAKLNAKSTHYKVDCQITY